MDICFRSVLRVILLFLMVFCFMAQMWEQFDKFLKKQTTVAVSFEDRETQKFPTFAFCDSRAYNTKILFAATAARYNETTFDVESEIDLSFICEAEYDCKKASNVTERMVPTTFNGYCKLYEFHEAYKPGSYAGQICSLITLSKLRVIYVLGIFQALGCLWTDHTMFYYLRMVRISHW